MNRGSVPLSFFASLLLLLLFPPQLPRVLPLVMLSQLSRCLRFLSAETDDSRSARPSAATDASAVDAAEKIAFFVRTNLACSRPHSPRLHALPLCLRLRLRPRLRLRLRRPILSH